MALERRLGLGRVLGSVLRRALLPHHLVQVFRHARRRGRHEAVYDFGKQMELVHGKELAAFNDPQLQLYARILPNDFLHYGYFDDSGTSPESISLATLGRAQNAMRNACSSMSWTVRLRCSTSAPGWAAWHEC
jgi:hypothetical protein